jgi:hypothetical protein
VPYIPSRHIPSPSLADGSSGPIENDLSSAFVGLNALEIAAVANAKKFFSQPVVQKVVNSIWSGDIVFWDSLNVHTKKKAQVYNQRYGHQALSFRPSFFFASDLRIMTASLEEQHSETTQSLSFTSSAR